MTIKKADRDNFKMLQTAYANGDLALVESRIAATGEYIALVCAMSMTVIDSETMIRPVPLAQMITGDPFEDYVDPTMPKLPAPVVVAPIEVRVLPMSVSSGDVDYYVEIKRGKRTITPYMFRNEEYKAQYEAASLRHVLLGTTKPDILAYSPEGWPK
jgi:hypothetical protein